MSDNSIQMHSFRNPEDGSESDVPGRDLTFDDPATEAYWVGYSDALAQSPAGSGPMPTPGQNGGANGTQDAVSDVGIGEPAVQTPQTAPAPGSQSAGTQTAGADAGAGGDVHHPASGPALVGPGRRAHEPWAPPVGARPGGPRR